MATFKLEFLEYFFKVTLVYRIFLYIRDSSFYYWQNRGVACENPWPVLGNMVPLLLRKISNWEQFKQWYRIFPGQKCVGVYVFMRPKLVIRSLDYIKRIAIDDFDSFMDRKAWALRKLMCKGQDWKNLRSTINPAFSNGSAKHMIPSIAESAEQVVDHLQKQRNNVTFDMSDLSRRYANDSIFKIIFDCKTNSFVDQNNSIYNMGKELTKRGELRTTQFSILSSIPILAFFTTVTKFYSKFTSTFGKLSKEYLQSRQDKKVVRRDLIDLMLQASKGVPIEHKNLAFDAGYSAVGEYPEIMKNATKVELSDELLTSQSMQFLLFSLEFTSNLICCMSHELAVSVDIQTKLLKEIDASLKQHHGIVTYESIAGMKYLDMVVSETLRKYPPFPLLERICLKDYELEARKKKKNALTIQKNTVILIPVVGLHYDPSYFPKPDLFDPERFNDTNKLQIKPFSYLPFGIGPRNCIGSRIALLQTKIFFVKLLSKYTLVATATTKKDLRPAIKSFSFVPDDGFSLAITSRSKIRK